MWTRQVCACLPYLLVCFSGKSPTNPCKSCHFYQTFPFAEYGMVSLCPLPQKAPHAPSSLFTFRKCSLNCKRRHVQAIDLHRVEAFTLHLLPAAYDVLPSFKASAKLHVALDENLGISTTVLVLPASTVRRSRKVDSTPCKTSMVQSEGSWNDAKDQEDISIRSTKNQYYMMSAQPKKTSILCQMAMVSRSKLPFSINRKCSSFACCMEQSHRGQGALLAHFDATRCCGVIRISTNLHRAQKRMLPCQIKKGPILMFSSVKPAVFLIEQVAKLFLMFLPSFDIFRTRYRIWTSTIWVWIDLGHVAQSTSFLCSKSNFSLRFFLGMLVHFVLYSFQFISFRFGSYLLI